MAILRTIRVIAIRLATTAKFILFFAYMFETLPRILLTQFTRCNSVRSFALLILPWVGFTWSLLLWSFGGAIILAICLPRTTDPAPSPAVEECFTLLVDLESAMKSQDERIEQLRRRLFMKAATDAQGDISVACDIISQCDQALLRTRTPSHDRDGDQGEKSPEREGTQDDITSTASTSRSYVFPYNSLRKEWDEAPDVTAVAVLANEELSANSNLFRKPDEPHLIYHRGEDGREELFQFQQVFDHRTSNQLVFDKLRTLLEGFYRGANLAVINDGLMAHSRKSVIFGTEDDPGLVNRVVSFVVERGLSKHVSLYLRVARCDDAQLYDTFASAAPNLVVPLGTPDEALAFLKNFSRREVFSVSSFREHCTDIVSSPRMMYVSGQQQTNESVSLLFLTIEDDNPPSSTTALPAVHSLFIFVEQPSTQSTDKAHQQRLQQCDVKTDGAAVRSLIAARQAREISAQEGAGPTFQKTVTPVAWLLEHLLPVHSKSKFVVLYHLELTSASSGPSLAIMRNRKAGQSVVDGKH